MLRQPSRLHITFSVIALFGTLAFVAMSHAAETPQAYGADVQIAPSPKAADAFLLKVSVKDLASGTVVAGPSVLLRSGGEASTSSTFGNDGSVEVTANVDKVKGSVNFSVLVTRNKMPMFRNSAAVRLQ